ncbi:hypothetical protein CIN_19110 [Commensalibacter intestini A911]|uniref:Phage neck terminator protein gp12-like domain-containing protein n=2 Tax=Commensalibacter intestini TaxID=479936 RepID=A0A251ZV25_9PROT|nr:hypothetical protein [Commensalibacter intestini]EHD13174.1 hypothetical protein CIN_19110 [Commensalibacter intestini A911]OUI78517.1 hypothetical protein HK18_08370 [Commensalibacter intestini]
MRQKKTPAQVTATAPEEGEFPELKNLSYKEMYNIVGKFIQKAIPIKGAKLKIVKGFNNRVATPKPPYVVLQIIDENQISTTETRYTDKHKILWARSEITMHMSFVGTGNIAALQMAKSFAVRFNDSWASEQFEQYSDIFFPLYSDDVKVEKFSINAEDQYDDSCSVTSYFEYHPEFGVCTDSGKEIIMDMNIADEG